MDLLNLVTNNLKIVNVNHKFLKLLCKEVELFIFIL